MTQKVFHGPAFLSLAPSERGAEPYSGIQPLVDRLAALGVEVMPSPDDAPGRHGNTYRMGARAVTAEQMWIHHPDNFPEMAEEIAKIGNRVSFIPLPMPHGRSVDRATKYVQDGVIVRYVRAYVLATDEMCSRWDVLVVPA